MVTITEHILSMTSRGRANKPNRTVHEPPTKEKQSNQLPFSPTRSQCYTGSTKHNINNGENKACKSPTASSHYEICTMRNFNQIYCRQIVILGSNVQEFHGRRRRTCCGKSHGATIRMWLLNKFISFLAVLCWKTGLKEKVDKVLSEAHIFLASANPSNSYISSRVSCTDFLYYTAQ